MQSSQKHPSIVLHRLSGIESQLASNLLSLDPFTRLDLERRRRVCHNILRRQRRDSAYTQSLRASGRCSTSV